ncbi:MAG TPA: hypothetical protein VGF13_18860 [Verrucomicrobiae bacterium]
MDILSLVLGSALTILGGYLSNRQASKLARVTAIRKTRTEKLEQLASLTVGATDWVEKMEEDAFAFPPRHTPSEPMDQMYMLSDLYFPEVSLQVHEFCRTARELCQCIRKEAGRRLDEKSANRQGTHEYLALQRQMLQKYTEEYLPIHKQLVEKQDALIKALRTVVEKLDV